MEALHAIRNPNEQSVYRVQYRKLNLFFRDVNNPRWTSYRVPGQDKTYVVRWVGFPAGFSNSILWPPELDTEDSST